MATTGERIKEIRLKLGFTQDALATQAGITKGFLSDVENKNSNIGAQNLLRIANVLGASVDYLLEGVNKETSLDKKPVIIPPELSRAAEQLGLTYSDTLEVLEAHKSIVARRSNKAIKNFTEEDWKKLHSYIKKVFG